jgi:hypothetical protein
VTLKATLAATVAALVVVSVWFLVAHAGRTEPKSQIDQIELGRR